METHQYSTHLKLCTALVIAILVCFAVYWPGLHGPFIFDDLTNILLVEEIRLQDLSWQAIQKASFSRVGIIGRPLSMLSFALNYYFSGYDVFYFKLTNLLIHFVNAWLLYWLVSTLLTRSSNPEFQNLQQSRGQILFLAASVSIIWLVHPLNLTSILYVVQRMNSLATVFMLLGMLLYAKGRIRLNDGDISGAYTILGSVILCTTLAVLCKENGILLPAYMLLIEAIFFQFKSNVNLPVFIRNSWKIIGIAGVVCISFVILFYPEFITKFLDYHFRNFTLSERLLTEPRVIWFYISLIFLPVGSRMGLFHDDLQISTGLLSPPTTIFSILGLILLLLFALYSYKKRPIIAFGILWFLLGHLIESTALPLELVHEHRNYLPQIGLLLIPVYIFLNSAKPLVIRPSLRQVPVILVMIIFSGITYVRAHNWESEWTLYNMMYLHHPDSVRTNSQLGILYHDNNATEQATYHFTRAATRSSKDAIPIIQLAHHLLSSNVKVPSSLLDELDHRLQKYNFSYTTLFIFEGFLDYSVRSPHTHRRLLEIYENVLLHRLEQISPVYRAGAYRKLAFGFREQKQYNKSIRYFDKAAAYKATPVDFISPAEIEMKRGNVQKSREYLDVLESKKLLLSDEEVQSILKLQSIIKRKNKDINSGK